MGAWSVSITGNDTAQDLKSEYQAAFFYNNFDVALHKIDDYVRTMFDESDEEEWCNYYYSLADYMWNKGILPDEVKNKVVNMIDSGFGLELWAESGNIVLQKRKQALEAFKKKILTQQPSKKKIKVDLHMHSIFESGDIVAFQLKTSDKKYIPKDSKFDENYFAEVDGKYVVIRKLADHISYTSSVEPNVRDVWTVCQLYGKIFDEYPCVDDLCKIPWASNREPNGVFMCESSMFYFKKRKYMVIGNNQEDITQTVEEFRGNELIFFSINMSHYNADTLILNAIL